MPTLPNSKHERFAQLRFSGRTAVESYIEAGYAKAGAKSNATRLMENDGVLARIKELQTRVADAVVMDRTRRVAILEDSVNRKLALREFRAAMYGHQLGEGRTWVVHDEAEEKQALAEGFDEEKYPDKPVAPGYPRTLHHPGFPIGGATGLLVKDYRGKNAEQEIWKADVGLESSIRDDLKQIAIEEGQWGEKRSRTPRRWCR